MAVKSATKGTLYSDVGYLVGRVVPLLLAILAITTAWGALFYSHFFNITIWEVLLQLVRLCWALSLFLRLLFRLFIADFCEIISYLAVFHLYESFLYLCNGKWSCAGVISLWLVWYYLVVLLILSLF